MLQTSVSGRRRAATALPAPPLLPPHLRSGSAATSPIQLSGTLGRRPPPAPAVQEGQRERPLETKLPSAHGHACAECPWKTAALQLQQRGVGACLQTARLQREQRAGWPLTLRPLGENGHESLPPPAELLPAALLRCPSSVEPSPSGCSMTAQQSARSKANSLHSLCRRLVPDVAAQCQVRAAEGARDPQGSVRHSTSFILRCWRGCQRVARFATSSVGWATW